MLPYITLAAAGCVLSYVIGISVGTIRTRRRYLRMLNRSGSRFGADDL